MKGQRERIKMVLTNPLEVQFENSIKAVEELQSIASLMRKVPDESLVEHIEGTMHAFRSESSDRALRYEQGINENLISELNIIDKVINEISSKISILKAAEANNQQMASARNY